MSSKKISVIAPYERPWSDVELIKECILMPYILYKNHGYDVTIVGKAPEGVSADTYSEENMINLPDGIYDNYRYISGVKFDLLNSFQEEERINYLKNNYENIDVLYLRGVYELNMKMAPEYKRLRQEGVVVCALDANSYWMDRIYWYLPQFTEFMNSCDVIATSCTAMADMLSIKWPWKVHSIINGFFNLSGVHKGRIPFYKRENIILTVGRLGTWQKATEVLLKAFVIAHDYIPDWKLCLVGSIEEEFKTFLDEFLAENGCLSERIICTGVVSDRDKLAELYDSAKIYALTSRIEGGTNNATAEALGRGLIPVTSRIDAYEDITDYGRIGRSFEIGDVDSLSRILIELCNSSDLEKESEKVYTYAEKTYDMIRITEDLNGLIERCWK